MKKPRLWRRWMAGLFVAIIAGGLIIGNLLRQPTCPLSIEVNEVRINGHRYHVFVSIRNPTNEAVAVLREEEGFPEVFLTKEADWESLQSQAVGARPPHSYSNQLEWSSIPPQTTESVEIVFHVAEGDDSVFAELLWDPDFGFIERVAKSVWQNLPNNISSSRFGGWFRDVGASLTTQGDTFIPSEIVSSHQDSPLRAKAAVFIQRKPPKEFADAPSRVSYKAIKSYAESELESLTKDKRVTLERDAFELYERYETSFTDEAIIYSRELYELVEGICQEVEFLHPDVWHGRG